MNSTPTPSTKELSETSRRDLSSHPKKAKFLDYFVPQTEKVGEELQNGLSASDMQVEETLMNSAFPFTSHEMTATLSASSLNAPEWANVKEEISSAIVEMVKSNTAECTKISASFAHPPKITHLAPMKVEKTLLSSIVNLTEWQEDSIGDDTQKIAIKEDPLEKAKRVITPPPSVLFFSPPIEEPLSFSISSLSGPQCDAIIAETSSAIIHMAENGDKETTLRLDGEWCKGSPLEGVQLVIKEFSTAPLVYTITFRCSPTSLNFLQPCLAALASALHSEQKSYGICSVDAELEDTSLHTFRRKPSLGRDQQGQDHKRDQRG